MNYRYVAVAVTVGALMVLTPMSAGAQSETTTAPRTPWGEPDLQGVWHSSGVTPMERPDEHQGRVTLTDEETAQIRGESAARAQQVSLAEARRTVAGGNVGAYNSFWNERGTPTNRTSMVVDPPDGRYPALTPAGEIGRTDISGSGA